MIFYCCRPRTDRYNLDVMARSLLIGDLRFRALCDFNELCVASRDTLSNSCAMTLTTSFLHHRANRSLKTATKLNDVQPNSFRTGRQDDYRVCDYRVRHLIFGGRELRFGQAACLTIAQRFGRSSALPPRSGLERSDFVLWPLALYGCVAAIRP